MSLVLPETEAALAEAVRAAHAAGLQTIMVPDIVAPSDEISALCVAVMHSLHDLRTAAFTAA